jgi:hypothetical protein
MNFPVLKLTTILAVSIGTLQFRVLIKDYAQKSCRTQRWLMIEAFVGQVMEFKYRLLSIC